jgi:beta-N-acetylhexosaminidase
VSSAVAEGTLTSKRVSEAMSRVRGLGEDLKSARMVAGPPPRSVLSWPKGEADLIQALDVQPGAADWRGRAAGRYAVVRLETDPNIAIGTTPWGPFAAVTDPTAATEAAFAKQPVYLSSRERSPLPPLHPDQPVLVVGRDIHRHRFAREVVDRLRSDRVDVLVVDMGWPSTDRRYADVATFGASRLMGAVLLKWLTFGGDAAD